MTLRAYGRDRLESSDADRPVLLALYAKGWKAREDGSLTSPEHPGTAVLWDDRNYEVIAIEALPAGGARYRLEPWSERHVMRSVDRYDEQAEEARRRDRERETQHRRYRALAYFTALAIGHLPAHIQERFEDEYDISAAALTTISALPWIVIGIVCVIALIVFMVSGNQILPVSTNLLLAGVYLFAESGLRLSRSIHGEPCGSLAGSLVWTAWEKIRGASRR